MFKFKKLYVSKIYKYDTTYTQFVIVGMIDDVIYLLDERQFVYHTL